MALCLTAGSVRFRQATNDTPPLTKVSVEPATIHLPVNAATQIVLLKPPKEGPCLNSAKRSTYQCRYLRCKGIHRAHERGGLGYGLVPIASTITSALTRSLRRLQRPAISMFKPDEALQSDSTVTDLSSSKAVLRCLDCVVLQVLAAGTSFNEICPATAQTGNEGTRGIRACCEEGWGDPVDQHG
jgi:hypothetical protein